MYKGIRKNRNEQLISGVYKSNQIFCSTNFKSLNTCRSRVTDVHLLRRPSVTDVLLLDVCVNPNATNQSTVCMERARLSQIQQSDVYTCNINLLYISQTSFCLFCLVLNLTQKPGCNAVRLCRNLFIQKWYTTMIFIFCQCILSPKLLWKAPKKTLETYYF